MKVLIVDDNKNDRMLLTKTLASNGYETAEASNGVEALASIKESKPDLIISDIMMPVMDGFTFLRKLKQDEKSRDIPFVFHTAHYIDKKDGELATSLGASRFIVKPEEPIDLLYEIDMVMKEHAAGRLKPTEIILESDEEYLKQYSERIVRKLEDKYSELEQTKNFLDTVLNNMNDGVIATDPELNITYYNRRMQQIVDRRIEYGINLSEVIPNPCIHDADYASCKLFETNVPCKNGEIVNIEGGISTVTKDNGKLSAYVGVFRDVTERNRALEEIEKKNLELGILHDFDRLLSTCMNSDELMERALNRIMEILYLEESCLHLVEKDNKKSISKIALKKCIGMSSIWMELIGKQAIDHPAVQRILTSDEPVMIPSMSVRVPGILEADEKYDDMRILTFHLHSMGKIIGFIDLMVPPHKEITADDKSLLHSIGIQLGISLDDLLMYEQLEQLVEERTEELKKKNEELEKMNDLFVGRELKVIELKERIKKLETQNTG